MLIFNFEGANIGIFFNNKSILEDKLAINRFLALSAGIPVIDVRSPGEFGGGHIPGAVNLPLFSDDERADIGTIYKQQNPAKAFLKGLDYVGPKMSGFVTAARKIAPEGKILVHCWRGGQRSGSMAWLLRSAGMQVGVLEGGYKAYRNHLHTLFEKKWDLRIVGGETGSGKTAILKYIAAHNEQVLDLEAIASHRGSSFGAIGLPGQPTVEQFENEVFYALSKLDPGKTTWLEDESRSIGRVYIPEAFWNQMLESPVLRISIPREIRVQRLVEEYSRFPLPELEAAVLRIRKRLGDLATRQAVDALQRGDFASTAEIVLKYYDKAYDHTHAVRAYKNVYRIPSETENPQENAAAVLAFAEKLRHSHT